MNRKYPPYGLHVLDLKKTQKIRLGIYVLMGEHSWNYAKGHRAMGHATLVLPPANYPHEYKWDVVSNLNVLVIVTSDVSYEIIRSIAYELLKANAFVVHIINQAGQIITFRQGERYNDS